MEVSKTLDISSIPEIKILSNVRLIGKRDLNPIYSKDNLQAQFSLTGELKGNVNCFLCLDGHELTPSDKNFIFPLFIESMNILVGKQVSVDQALRSLKIKISPPKLSMISKEVNTSLKSGMQFYELELDGSIFSVLTEYSLEAIN